jgi:hypothetical protein
VETVAKVSEIFSTSDRSPKGHHTERVVEMMLALHAAISVRYRFTHRFGGPLLPL